MKLTKEQKDYNESQKEKLREHNNERADGLFDNWKSDNLKNLKEEFIEANYDFFIDYCKEAFKEWKDD